MNLTVAPFAPSLVDAFAELFERSSCPCFCRYWHFPGTKNDWLARCALASQENLAEQRRAVSASDASAAGLIAIDEAGSGVGWLKVAPVAAMPKLAALPVYRSFALEDPATWAIGCILIRPDMRRRGVARALVRAAPSFAAARGAKAILAFPRRSSEALHDEEVFQGPESLYQELGFSLWHGGGPYPVYRRTLEVDVRHF